MNEGKWHVRFDVRTSVDRFVELDKCRLLHDHDEEHDLDADAIDKAAEAPDEPDDFADADWQTEFVHPVTAKCTEPGAICWED